MSNLVLFLIRCILSLVESLNVMPPDMAISMRHSKLKASEAAILAGEVNKPSWESRNEGIHERVSFEDCIWGFDLAGGIYYNTPLRVTHVKADSRAEKAGIRPGDKLKRINDIKTETLTIQEAHDIIVESGVHLKLAVTAPEDEEDAYFCYQDPIDDGYDSEEERRKEEEEKARKRQVCAKVSSYWSLQWPWVSKRRIIYRESNCFMVPSKFEDKHKEQFKPQPFHKVEEDIVLDTMNNLNLKNAAVENEKMAEQPKNDSLSKELTNNIVKPTSVQVEEKPVMNADENISNGDVSNDENHVADGYLDNANDGANKNGLDNILEVDEDMIPKTPEPQEDSFQEISEAESETVPETDTTPLVSLSDEPNGNVEPKDEDVIEDLLAGDDVSDMEEVIDSILSESQEEDTVDET